MAKVVADISVSLDGYVTGPDPGPQQGLGSGGDGLHTWVFQGDAVDQRVLEEATAATGAVVMGRRLFDVDGAAPRDLRQIHVRPSGHATHLTYRVD